MHLKVTRKARSLLNRLPIKQQKEEKPVNIYRGGSGKLV